MSAPDSITTLVADHDGVSVVSVSGEIDLVTAPALEQAIGAVVADGPTALVIDLSAVEFLGSVGLKILAAIAQLSRSVKWCLISSSLTRHNQSSDFRNHMVFHFLGLMGIGARRTCRRITNTIFRRF